MKLHVPLLLGLALLVSAGCQNTTQQPAAHSEEPYTPSHASLDSMDTAPAADTILPYEPAPAETVTPASTSGEILEPVGGQVYTVQKGDTLYKLARRFYNDQSRWRDIWTANKAQIPDPNKLRVGMKLTIP